MRALFPRTVMCAAVAASALFLAGCGYTTRSLLSSEFRSIYVDNFVNKIDVSGESSDLRMYRGYRHGLEIQITDAVSGRFIFDGNLRIADRDNADLALTGDLLDFRKEGVRYDSNDVVEEYRVRLVVDITLRDAKKDKVLWREKDFAGEFTYRTSGALASSESAGIQGTIDDLARRIVERVVEGW
ncbi:MAG: LPS assembly lipoprotein LptE [Candidatus Omnitrophota bacterium]